MKYCEVKINIISILVTLNLESVQVSFIGRAAVSAKLSLVFIELRLTFLLIA